MRLTIALIASVLLAACGGGGGGAPRTAPPTNGSQPTPAPSAFWGEPFIGQWQLHATSDILLNPDRYPNFPATATALIERVGDQLGITLQGALALGFGSDEVATVTHENLVDPEQLNPGGPSNTPYIRASSLGDTAALIWYDAAVEVGTWIDGYYVGLDDSHPRLWNQVIEFVFAVRDTGNAIPYFAYKW